MDSLKTESGYNGQGIRLRTSLFAYYGLESNGNEKFSILTIDLLYPRFGRNSNRSNFCELAFKVVRKLFVHGLYYVIYLIIWRKF